MASLTNAAVQSHHPTSYTLASGTPQLISAARNGRTLLCQVVGSGSVLLGAGAADSANNVGTGFGMTVSNPTLFTDSATTTDWWATAVTGTVTLQVDEIY